MSGETRRRRVRRRWLPPLLAAGVLLALYLLRVPLLVGVARLVIVEDPLRPAGMIFLLNGGAMESVRARHAVALFRRGLAPRIVLARTEDPHAVELGLYPNQTDVTLAVLRRYGVPDSALVVLRRPGGVTSTTDEAMELGRYLREHPTERVIVVTSDYHTARTRWNLRRALKGTSTELVMSGAEDPEMKPTNWWRSEKGLILYVEEYLKFVHNWLYR